MSEHALGKKKRTLFRLYVEYFFCLVMVNALQNKHIIFKLLFVFFRQIYIFSTTIKPFSGIYRARLKVNLFQVPSSLQILTPFQLRSLFNWNITTKSLQILDG